MSDGILKKMNEKMEQAIQAFSKNLATVRAGRANPALLDSVFVEYYGMSTPLNQIASVSAPEARLLVVTPFDKSAISDIEKGIQKADLGISPSSDGNVIRINIPALTEERRKDLVKVVGKYAEESRVQVRNIRREANDQLKKEDGISEDDIRALQDDVQKATDKYIAQIDQLAKDKEKEIMEV
ncbi:ribosome-recycling factor [Virgibacillus pantothenticus]|uniref:Ribosome-recycling factor n=1 Tax=Virgibacillus pantothenticus TaxID=1473 RepID=A0A0L0QNS8_VIRPA|nr:MULTISPECIES: ribosome recycling factor [Virgibacillus]API93917.1 ribosome recycling factor [Virgibacillus sp. 6R]KNE20201.1 ribosome recycling factor [Virgibacillus pantothenticus]MBS7427539.1 ribosome recycling factor [Virgibacillus sp. 19R1-5]MBU8565971.1 ribosome recycling factor [Virgibacillus pantothenticus]MBU8600948.1 ribosome recycling factor [Virgibacillus pantothenticus]